MRRFARVLFTLLTAASLLLCLAVCAAWARSYAYADSRARWVTVPTGPYSGWTRTDHVFWNSGTLYVAHSVQAVSLQHLARDDYKDSGGAPLVVASDAVQWSHEAAKARLPAAGPRFKYEYRDRWEARAKATWSMTSVRAIGFTWQSQDFAPYQRSLSIEVPLWMLAVLFGIVPMSRLLARFARFVRRRRRVARGRCGACGYDLRASAERCPECGEMPAASRLQSSRLAIDVPR